MATRDGIESTPGQPRPAQTNAKNNTQE